jgi:hypothetical protein
MLLESLRLRLPLGQSRVGALHSALAISLALRRPSGTEGSHRILGGRRDDFVELRLEGKMGRPGHTGNNAIDYRLVAPFRDSSHYAIKKFA